MRCKERPARKVDNLTAICETIVYKMWDTRRLTNLRAFTACYGESFTFTFTVLLLQNYIYSTGYGAYRVQTLTEDDGAGTVETTRYAFQDKHVMPVRMRAFSFFV
jgi:hypothetical protein